MSETSNRLATAARVMRHEEQRARAKADASGWDLIEKLIIDAYVRGVEWNEENPLDREYRFKAACDYAEKTIYAARSRKGGAS